MRVTIPVLQAQVPVLMALVAVDGDLAGGEWVIAGCDTETEAEANEGEEGREDGELHVGGVRWLGS